MNVLKKFLYFVTICVLLGFAAVPVLSAPTAAFTVNSTGDLSDIAPGDGVCDYSSASGSQCSLRAAIEEANTLGSGANPHQIGFSIPGTGPFTISPASPLPPITVPVVIDGSTQPGAACASATSPAHLLIVLDGSNAGNGISGLVLQTGSYNVVLKGLVIGNFDSNGIQIVSSNNSVFCSFIGISADGVTSMGNGGDGISISGVSNNIGSGTDVSLRNVISDNMTGIRVEDTTTSVYIRNNYIGTTADGRSPRGNLYGIYVSGNNNRVGGGTTLGGNLISGNIGPGIRINNGQFNHIDGNIIGSASNGVTPLPNSGNGIEILGDSYGNTVGGSGPGQSNIIAHNLSNGIALQAGQGIFPIENVIRGNSIYENTILGIDLGMNGVDSNDPGDADGGENEHQNYPVLQASTSSPTILVSIDSQANTSYIVDIYRNLQCSPSDYGEGRDRLVSTTLSTGATGHAETSLDLSGIIFTGDILAATAIDPSSNTSEFSACVTVLFETAPTPTSTGTPTSTSTPTPTPTQPGAPTSTPTPTPTQPDPKGGTPAPTASPTPTPAFQLFLPVTVK